MVQDVFNTIITQDKSDKKIIIEFENKNDKFEDYNSKELETYSDNLNLITDIFQRNMIEKFNAKILETYETDPFIDSKINKMNVCLHFKEQYIDSFLESEYYKKNIIIVVQLLMVIQNQV
jgi:uncharacterized protein (DUF1330 family)